MANSKVDIDQAGGMELSMISLAGKANDLQGHVARLLC